MKSLEQKYKDEVEDLNTKLDKQMKDASEKELYLSKEKADLQSVIAKLQNNDFLKLQAEYNDKMKELNQTSSELKQMKERGTSEYLKNNFTFEMEKKSL